MPKLSTMKCLEFIREIEQEQLPDGSHNYNLKQSKVGTEIRRLDKAAQASLALNILRRYNGVEQRSLRYSFSLYRDSAFKESSKAHLDPERNGGVSRIIQALLQILNRQLPFKHDEVIEILNAVFEPDSYLWRFGTTQALKLTQHYLSEKPLTAALHDAIAQAAQCLQEATICEYEKEFKRDALKFQKLIQSEKSIPIFPGEAWSDVAIQDISDSTTKFPWIEIFINCGSISGSKPSNKWSLANQLVREQIGIEDFNTQLIKWFRLVDQPRTQPLPDWRGGADLIQDQNADILKGLVWLCADQTDPDLVRAISALAVSAYRKVPGIGARCVKLGNACVWTLGQMPCEEAVAQLALLKAKVKFGSAQIGIDKALTAAAQRLNISRDEIEELAIPTYGLTEVGIRRETFATDNGDYTAELKITGTSSTTLTWVKPDGKPQKSVPKVVKDNHADALKALKQAAKDIQKMLPAQRDRIDNLFLAQKTWDYETWRDRYLNHPLIGSLTRRIIWQFNSADGQHSTGIWIDSEGQICDRQLQPIDWLDESNTDAQTTVQLWHPITTSTEAIQAWRELLLNQQIQQPFKQAHRELYLLTAAEETTHIYSNRFAAHILKQHQFNALAKQRGWKNQLRLMVDDCYEPARRILGNWGLRAEFWVEGIGDEYGTDTTEAGTYLHLSTDQVRFYPLEATANLSHAVGGHQHYDVNEAQSIPLNEIPALVLSEILRDVDLFVGVASIGNDPNWIDGGTEGHHHDYWHSYSFGDLSATAQTRRQVLETLVPRLKIKDRCHFQDKFLVVRGDIRTYKIHLGSGNILMEPNNQYLCIVPGRSAGPAGKVFLPFEGDRVMAIILSKAFLLAADTKIKDETILQQIR